MADICCDLYASCHISIEGITIIYIHIVEEKQRMDVKGITW
jgi:hypothetical protein